MIIKTVYTITVFSEVQKEHYAETGTKSLLELERDLMANPKYAQQAFQAALQSGKAQMAFEVKEHKEEEEG